MATRVSSTRKLRSSGESLNLAGRGHGWHRGGPQSRSRVLRVEELETRAMLAGHTLYLDFGTSFPAAGLTLTSAQLSAINAPALGASVTLTSLNTVMTADKVMYSNIDQAVLDVVEQEFAPFNVTVTQAYASSYSSVLNTLNSAPAGSVYAFVTGAVSNGTQVGQTLANRGAASAQNVGVTPGTQVKMTTFTFADTILTALLTGPYGVATADREVPLSLGATATQEAGTAFGVGTTTVYNPAPEGQSDVMNSAVTSTLIWNSPIDGQYLYFSRFPLPYNGTGNNEAPYDVLASMVGLNSSYSTSPTAGGIAYVTGSGVYDIIDITADPSHTGELLVVISPHVDPTKPGSTPVPTPTNIPGGTVYTAIGNNIEYDISAAAKVIDVNTGIGGVGTDPSGAVQVVVDASVANSNVVVFGMGPSDSVVMDATDHFNGGTGNSASFNPSVIQSTLPVTGLPNLVQDNPSGVPYANVASGMPTNPNVGSPFVDNYGNIPSTGATERGVAVQFYDFCSANSPVYIENVNAAGGTGLIYSTPQANSALTFDGGTKAPVNPPLLTPPSVSLGAYARLWGTSSSGNLPLTPLEFSAVSNLVGCLTVSSANNDPDSITFAANLPTAASIGWQDFTLWRGAGATTLGGTGNGPALFTLDDAGAHHANSTFTLTGASLSAVSGNGPTSTFSLTPFGALTINGGPPGNNTLAINDSVGAAAPNFSYGAGITGNLVITGLALGKTISLSNMNSVNYSDSTGSGNATASVMGTVGNDAFTVTTSPSSACISISGNVTGPSLNLSGLSALTINGNAPVLPANPGDSLWDPNLTVNNGTWTNLGNGAGILTQSGDLSINYISIETVRLPIQANLSVAPTTINEGGNLAVTSTSKGLGGDTLYYQWMVNGNTASESVATTTAPTALTWPQLYSLGMNNGAAGAGTSYTLTLVVTDIVNSMSSAACTVVVKDTAPTLTVAASPTAAANGNYTLKVTGTDYGNDPVNSWSVNWGDGTTSTYAPTATTPWLNGSGQQQGITYTMPLTHIYSQGSGNYTITASAVETDGTFSIGSKVAITEALPGTFSETPPETPPNILTQFVVNFYDTGTHTAVWNWGDGTANTTATDGNGVNDPSGPLGVGMGSGIDSTVEDHAYAVPGTYTVVVYVTPTGGGLGGGNLNKGTLVNAAIPTYTNTVKYQFSVTVSPYGISTDPLNPAAKALVVGGTPGNDSIIVSNPDANGNFSLAYNNTLVMNNINGISDIIIYGNGGNDVITIGSKITVPCMLIGGSGNDNITGGGGRNLIYGGGGTDHLYGGSASDLIIAGEFQGNLVLPGTSTPNTQALAAIMAEWESSDSFILRMSYLGGTKGGKNQVGGVGYYLNTTTLLADTTGVVSIDGFGGGDAIFYNFSGPGLRDVLLATFGGDDLLQI